MDGLSLDTCRPGLTITDCLEKLAEFCTGDAYPRYDKIGYRYENEPDVLQGALRDAMNSAMLARSKRAAWDEFIDKSLVELSRVPAEVDLVDYRGRSTVIESQRRGSSTSCCGQTWLFHRIHVGVGSRGKEAGLRLDGLSGAQA